MSDPTIYQWSANKDYVRGDLVTYDTVQYRALVNITKSPSNQNPQVATSFWRPLVWASGVNYIRGDVVYFNSNYYRARSSISGNSLNTSPEQDVGKSIQRPWSEKSNYKAGEIVSFNNNFYAALVDITADLNNYSDPKLDSRRWKPASFSPYTPLWEKLGQSVIDFVVPGSYVCNPSDYDTYYRNNTPSSKETVMADIGLAEGPIVDVNGVTDQVPSEKKGTTVYWQDLKKRLLNGKTQQLISDIGGILDNVPLQPAIKDSVEDVETVRATINQIGQITALQSDLSSGIKEERDRLNKGSLILDNWPDYVTTAQNGFRRFGTAYDAYIDPKIQNKSEAELNALRDVRIHVSELGNILGTYENTLAAGVDAVAGISEFILNAAGNADAAKKCREQRQNLNDFYSALQKTQKDVFGPIVDKMDRFTDFKNNLERGMDFNQFKNSVGNLANEFKNNPIAAGVTNALNGLQSKTDDIAKLDKEFSELMNTISSILTAVGVIITCVCELIQAVEALIKFFKNLIPLLLQLILLTLVAALTTKEIHLKIPQVNIATAGSFRGLSTALAGLGKAFKKCDPVLKKLNTDSTALSSAMDGASDASSKVADLLTEVGKGITDINQGAADAVTGWLQELITQYVANPLLAAANAVTPSSDDPTPRPTVTPDIIGIIGRLSGAVSSIGFNLNKFGFGASDVDQLDLVKRISNRGQLPGQPQKAVVGADTYKHINNMANVLTESMKIVKTNVEMTQTMVAAARAMEKLGLDASEADSKDALEKILVASQQLSSIQNAVLDKNLDPNSMNQIAKDFYRCKQEDHDHLHSDQNNMPSFNSPDDFTTVTNHLNNKVLGIVNTPPGLPNSFMSLAQKIRMQGGTPVTDVLTTANLLQSLPQSAVSSSYYDTDHLQYISSYVSKNSDGSPNSVFALKFLPIILVVKNVQQRTTLLKFMALCKYLEDLINAPDARDNVINHVNVANKAYSNSFFGYLGKGFAALSGFNPSSSQRPDPSVVFNTLKGSTLINPYFLMDNFLSHGTYDVRPFITWLGLTPDKNQPFPSELSAPEKEAAYASELFLNTSPSLSFLGFSITGGLALYYEILPTLGQIILDLRKQADSVGGPMGYEYFITMAVHMLINEIRAELQKPKPNTTNIDNLNTAAKVLCKKLTHGEDMLEMLNNLNGIKGAA